MQRNKPNHCKPNRKFKVIKIHQLNQESFSLNERGFYENLSILASPKFICILNQFNVSQTESLQSLEVNLTTIGSFFCRPNLSGGGEYPVPWKHTKTVPTSKSFPNQKHPRVIFISSRVPAADVSLIFLLGFLIKGPPIKKTIFHTR